MPTMKKLGARLKAFRLRAGLNHTEVAAKMGISQGTYSRWEADKTEPTPTNVIALAMALGVSIEQLMADTSLPGRKIRVKGVLAAGAFKEAIEWEYGDQYDVPVMLPDDLVGLPMEGFEVEGTSVNRYYPHGSIVYITPIHALPGRPKTGDFVMVMRRDRHGLTEATLKQYEIDTNGKQWLWPRSDDPEHQAPVDYLGKKEDGIEEVIITGVVMAATTFNRR